MAVECLVIFLILAILIMLFFRAKRKKWGWSTCPLLLLPFANVVLHYIYATFIHQSVNVQAGVFVNFFAIIASCVWIGIMAGSFKNKKTKIGYTSVCVAFNILLGVILINDVLTTVV